MKGKGFGKTFVAFSSFHAQLLASQVPCSYGKAMMSELRAVPLMISHKTLVYLAFLHLVDKVDTIIPIRLIKNTMSFKRVSCRHLFNLSSFNMTFH